MGMEISSRRLQEADSRMQAEREGADRPVDDRDKERFDRAMQESQERDGQGGQENSRGGSRQDALSPQALLDKADYISEMRCVRHPYDTKGVGARKGIEY